MKRGTAYFISRPRTHEDLTVPHLAEEEHTYEIVKHITLTGIEYENFSLDMLADRQFIEENADLCSEGNIFKCLLISKKGRNDGILVVPDGTAFVKFAAYISEVQ